MTQKRRRCDKQFKIAAARVVLGGEMRAVDLAREPGIKGPTLRRWAQEHGGTGESAFPGNGSPKVNKDYEIAKLRKKVEELERESRGQGVRRRIPQQAMGGRHRLHRDGRRTALPRSRDRRVPQEGRGPVDVRAHDREAGRRCARAGSRKGEPARRLQPRLPRRPGPGTLPGRSGAAPSPMGSPDPCRGRATHGTTRSRNPSSRRSSASWRAARAARRGRRRSGTCSNTSSSTATGRGCTHRSAITPRAT